MMMSNKTFEETLETVLEGVKRWNPNKILTQPDDVYCTLKEGEIVVDFNDELMMTYCPEKGFWQISYDEWVGDYVNPLPVIEAIMTGSFKTAIETDGKIDLFVLDQNKKPVRFANTDPVLAA